MKLYWREERTVVDAVAQQTSQAAGLARIEGQELLADPSLNPNLRGYNDQLRDEEQRASLNLKHRRALRRNRVEDGAAARAENALNAVAEAREQSSAARSVLALHEGRKQFMRAALSASILLSTGSALGLAALAEEQADGKPINFGAFSLDPSLTGLIAEVGLTGLTTTVILYRSHLAQYSAETGWKKGWMGRVLWLLMIAPLVASMAANAVAAGPVGIACSIGAAAFSLLSYLMADASAVAIQSQVARVRDEDVEELRRAAAGDPVHEPVREPAPELTVTRTDQVHEPAVLEVREPVRELLPANQELGPVHEPEPVDPDANREVHELDHEPVREPQDTNPEPVNRMVHEPTAPKTGMRTPTSLPERKKSFDDEVQQVLELMEELGYENVNNPVLRSRLGFTKTFASLRLKAARELWNANQEPATVHEPEAVNGS